MVLNKSHVLLRDEEFDVEVATTRLLSDADQSLSVNSDLARYVRYWRGQDHARNISCAQDLINCYYSSFKVVRIPEKGRYMLMNQQVKRLHDQISFCCRGSHEEKLQARRDLNADKLGECLQSGLDHFSSTLDIPFDFLAFSWSRNPIPPGFEGNILRLALEVKNSGRFFRGVDIFGHLGKMVASYIMLDFVRHRIKGELFPPVFVFFALKKLQGTPSELLEHYKPVLNSVLDKFCDGWWPYSYADKNGKKCINTREGHVKGHQDKRGKLFGNGYYQSYFLPEFYRPIWQVHLQEMLLNIENCMKQRYPASLSHHHTSEEKEAAKLHLQRINGFYQTLGGAERFYSNLSCFSCLRDMPEHPLPCGHVICSPCVRTFGEQTSKTAFSLESCPLHQENHWQSIVQISLKPHLAGVRILSLNG